MTVSHGGEYRRYECRRAQLDYAASPCQAFPVRHLDAAVDGGLPQGDAAGHLGDDAVTGPRAAGAQGATGAIGGCALSVPLRGQRLAERQYDAVDPDNRLVARALETRWNDALRSSRSAWNGTMPPPSRPTWRR